MGFAIIAPPAPVVSLDEAKSFLRVEHNDDDTVISALIAAAQGTIDGPFGWLGRSIGEQTIEFRAHCFDDEGLGGLRLRCPPIINVLSVATIGHDNASQVLDPAAYYVDECDYLRPAEGCSWPYLRRRHDAVRVRYRAGYEAAEAEGSTVSTVPAPIRQAILMMVSLMFDNRDHAVDLQAHPTVASLLAPYRIWRC